MTSSCVGLKDEKGAPIYQRPSLVAQQIVKLYYFLTQKKRKLSHSTVTDFARLRGLSTSVPRAKAV